jgi:hypothetical protein
LNRTKSKEKEKKCTRARAHTQRRMIQQQIYYKKKPVKLIRNKQQTSSSVQQRSADNHRKCKRSATWYAIRCDARTREQRWWYREALGQRGRGREGRTIGRGATGANIHAMEKNKRNSVKL